MNEFLIMAGQTIAGFYLVISALWGLSCCTVTYLTLFTNVMDGYLQRRQDSEILGMVLRGRAVLAKASFCSKLFWLPIAFTLCFLSSLGWLFVLFKK